MFITVFNILTNKKRLSLNHGPFGMGKIDRLCIQEPGFIFQVLLISEAVKTRPVLLSRYLDKYWKYCTSSDALLSA